MHAATDAPLESQAASTAKELPKPDGAASRHADEEAFDGWRDVAQLGAAGRGPALRNNPP